MFRNYLLLFTLFGMPLSGNASIINLTANLDCAAAAEGTGTCASGGTGTGLALITLDDVTNLLSWNISWSGLSGDVFAAHFHGTATPTQSAPPFIDLDVSSNPTIGSTTVNNAVAGTLLSGLTYINIHSTTFTLGEIRGQVVVNPVPVPASMWLFGSGLVGLIGLARKQASI